MLVGWPRAETVVANKLWWEFWPDQSAADELGASLARMGLDHVDLIYATPPPDTLPEHVTVREIVESAAGLIASGMARQWAVAMWSASQLGEALDIAAELHAPPPVANQLACSLVQHKGADDAAMVELMTNRGVGLVASYVLAGGTLTGKYIGGRGRPRESDDDAPPYGAGKQVAVALADLAHEWGVTTTQPAFCYALGHPCLTSALFGATSPPHQRENLRRTRSTSRSATINWPSCAPSPSERRHAVTRPSTRRVGAHRTRASAAIDKDREAFGRGQPNIPMTS